MGSTYATTSDIEPPPWDTGTVTWVDSNSTEWEVRADASEYVEFIDEPPPPPPLPPPLQSFPDRPRCGYRSPGRRPVFNGVRMFVK